jgi:hypothetical protein
MNEILSDSIYTIENKLKVNSYRWVVFQSGKEAIATG